MLKILILLSAGVMSLQNADLKKSLAPPVRLEAAGKPIDTNVGYAAPFVCDFDGDGDYNVLVGDLSFQKPDLPEPTPQEKAEQDRIRKELEPVQKQLNEILLKLSGPTPVSDKDEIEKLTRQRMEVQRRYTALRSKLPKEYDTHGWVWLFLRQK